MAQCDKRRQSDLFNILDALDVFGHVLDNRLIWRGFSAVGPALVRAGLQNEILSQSQSIQEIFAVGPSPSLSMLAVRFLSLYVFLGVPSLNLREVVVLMSDSEQHSKRILRRLYLVVFLLVQLEIIEHGYGYSEYVLKLPLENILTRILQELDTGRPFAPGSIESALNRIDADYIRRLHKRRNDAYTAASQKLDFTETAGHGRRETRADEFGTPR
jgi:hypothetical protein